MTRQLPVLPCSPCPHKGACCSWGTSVTEEEKAALSTRADAVFVWSVEEQGWRTAVIDGHCVFLSPGGGCRVHGLEHYPRVCRLFPHEDVEGGPYQHDLGVCPELRS